MFIYLCFPIFLKSLILIDSLVVLAVSKTLLELSVWFEYCNFVVLLNRPTAYICRIYVDCLEFVCFPFIYGLAWYQKGIYAATRFHENCKYLVVAPGTMTLGTFQ